MELDQAFTWRGRRVCWARYGTGPAVVFCHGTPWSSWLWAPFARSLSEGFTTYLWDMPGYGRSSIDCAHAVSLDVQGELLHDLLAYWGLSSPHVVAHDYGGAVALRAHLLHGSRLASLALVDVVALRPWGSPFFRLVADHSAAFAALPASMHEGLLRAYIAGASHIGLRPEHLDALMAPWRGPDGQAAFYAQIAQADERFTEQIEPHLASIDMPVTVIWGSEDAWIPVDRAYRLAELISGAELHVVEGAGHLIQLDRPVELAARLSAWMAHRGGRLADVS